MKEKKNKGDLKNAEWPKPKFDENKLREEFLFPEKKGEWDKKTQEKSNQLARKYMKKVKK